MGNYKLDSSNTLPLWLQSAGYWTVLVGRYLNQYGQRGLTEVPPGLTNATAVAAGSLHSLALRADGTVVAWGYNQHGQTNVPSGLSGIGIGVGAVVLASSLLGAISGMVIRLVYRFGVLKRLDKVAGIPLGAATAAVTLYVVLVGTVVVDGWLGPLHGGLAIGPEQLASVQKPFKAEDLEAQQALVDQSQAALEAAQVNLDEATVRAPVTGVVSQKLVSEGALVGQTTGIVSLLPPGLELDVPVRWVFEAPTVRADSSSSGPICNSAPEIRRKP